MVANENAVLTRQLEEHSGGPMLPKTLVLQLDAQALVDDATDYQQGSGAQLTFSASSWEVAADPGGTISPDEVSNEITLPAGKWLVECFLNVDNSAATAGDIEAALTDTATGASTVVFGQSSTANPWVTDNVAEQNTGVLSFVAHVTELKATAGTPGGGDETKTTTRRRACELRVANTGAAGANLSLVSGSYVRMTKISNQYDS